MFLNRQSLAFLSPLSLRTFPPFIHHIDPILFRTQGTVHSEEVKISVKEKMEQKGGETIHRSRSIWLYCYKRSKVLLLLSLLKKKRQQSTLRHFAQRGEVDRSLRSFTRARDGFAIQKKPVPDPSQVATENFSLRGNSGTAELDASWQASAAVGGRMRRGDWPSREERHSRRRADSAPRRAAPLRFRLAPRTCRRRRGSKGTPSDRLPISLPRFSPSLVNRQVSHRDFTRPPSRRSADFRILAISQIGFVPVGPAGRPTGRSPS